MAKRSIGPLLRLPVLQGRRPRQHQERLEEGRHRQRRLPRLPHRRLLHRMLRLQEQQAGQRVHGIKDIPLENLICLWTSPIFSFGYHSRRVSVRMIHLHTWVLGFHVHHSRRVSVWTHSDLTLQ